MILVLLFFVSLAAGFIVGLIGVGSTLIVLPTLLIVLTKWLPHAPAIKIAIANTLACTTISVSSAAWMHWKRGNVNVRLFCTISLVYIFTALIGARLVHILPEKTLSVMVGVMLVLLAIRLILKRSYQVRQVTQLEMSKIGFLCITPMAGLINSICGIGTGNIIIPFLSRYYLLQQAVGTSLASTVIACSLGAFAYIINGWGMPNLPAYSLGYLNLPVFVVMSLGIAITTPLGVIMSSRANTMWLRYVLICLVFLAGLNGILHGFGCRY